MNYSKYNKIGYKNSKGYSFSFTFREQPEVVMIKSNGDIIIQKSKYGKKKNMHPSKPL